VPPSTTSALKLLQPATKLADQFCTEFGDR
jgi:hypothetical protein